MNENIRGLSISVRRSLGTSSTDSTSVVSLASSESFGLNDGRGGHHHIAHYTPPVRIWNTVQIDHEMNGAGQFSVPHCLKITQNVAFEFFNFGIFHQFLSY